MGENSISAVDFDLDRTVSATADGVRVKLKPVLTEAFPLTGHTKHFDDLCTELRGLLAEKLINGNMVSPRLNPDDPYPPLKLNESEQVVELKCTNPSCSQLTVSMEPEFSRIQ